MHASPTPAGRLDMVLLRTFLEVVDQGGFALAAERLALTPSAVSGHIRRLEQASGQPLLARTTRRLELTAAGRLLYTYARSIVALEREARERLGGAAIAGRLRVGASEDFASAWLPAVLQGFRRWHPAASIELRVGITADLLRARERDDLDVVFGKRCALALDDGDALWEEPLVWAHAADAVPDPGQALPLALFPAPCAYREAALAALAAAQRTWRPAFESASMAGCIAAALAGFAVTPLARSQLRPGLQALDARHGLPPLPRVRFHAFAGPAPGAAVRALVAAVREAGERRRLSALAVA
ncbi:LysR family transcriptional regulator [Luteimonas sp. Y-2-2-4F]|nr:LysR substrate-binding domain-containing protein [Luteimonas sp. Y-2-2-4F]MCD9032780.1 LysR family transcriptional regulator [Luteimonas sp. Y-2-2-4F]